MPSDLLRLAKRAARMELWAVINTVAFASLAELIPDAWLEIPILGVGINFTLLLLMISGAAHALSGLLCLWGHEVAEPFNWVVLSRSLAEFLNRFMPQFKDFLATVFFYPVLFRLRKIPMALSFTLALAFTLMVDNTLAHLMRYAYSVSNDALALVRMVNVFWENTSLTVAMLLWILCGRVYSRAITRHPFLAIRNKTLKAVLRVVRFGIVYFLFAHLFYFHPRS